METPSSRKRQRSFFEALIDRSVRGPAAHSYERSVWKSPCLLSRFTHLTSLEEHRGKYLPAPQSENFVHARASR